MSRKKEATAKQTTRQLIGIDEITDSGLKTSHGRLIFFAIKPTNLSVQPPEAVSNRIYALMTVLKGQAEIEKMCIRDRCRAGAGPYGIGVSVVEDTPIDVFFTFDPDPVLDCKILPEEIPEYTVGVIGSWSGERKYLSREEVGQLLSASDPKTRILAEMLRYFEGKTWIVSCADCQEAFGILADAEMREAFGLDEQEQIGPKLEM